MKCLVTPKYLNPTSTPFQTLLLVAGKNDAILEAQIWTADSSLISTVPYKHFREKSVKWKGNFLGTAQSCFEKWASDYSLGMITKQLYNTLMVFLYL